MRSYFCYKSFKHYPLIISILFVFLTTTVYGMNGDDRDESASSISSASPIVDNDSEPSSRTKKKKKKKKKKNPAATPRESVQQQEFFPIFESAYFDNEDEDVDEIFGISIHPGERGFQLIGIPLDTIFAEDHPVRLNELGKLNEYIFNQRACLNPSCPTPQNRLRKLKLWRLRNMFGVQANLDPDLDGFERAAISTIQGSLRYGCSLLDSSKYTPSLQHILLVQDAILVQTYHLLFYRFDRLKSLFHFDASLLSGNRDGLDISSLSLNDIPVLMSGHIERTGRGRPTTQRNKDILKKIERAPWSSQARFLAQRLHEPTQFYLGGLVDESHLSMDIHSSLPLYHSVLCEILSPGSPVCCLPSSSSLHEFHEKYSLLTQRLDAVLSYSSISSFIRDIFEPLEDLAGLDVTNANLPPQHPQTHDPIEYYDMLMKPGDPKRFLLRFAVSRLYDLGKAISHHFPGTYFQRDSSTPPRTLKEALYRYIPFKVLRNIALNAHHGSIFKRDKSLKLLRHNMRDIVLFCKAILPFVKEYVLYLTADGLQQPHHGALSDKPIDDLQQELETLVSARPIIQSLSNSGINLSYLFFAHMTLPHVLEDLTKETISLSKWPIVMQNALCRALVILGETSKGITASVKEEIADAGIWKVLESFRNEFSHFKGAGFKLPQRLLTLFMSDTHTALVFEALDEMTSLYTFFSKYCEFLWTKKPKPKAPEINGSLQKLFDTICTLDISPLARVKPLPAVKRPENPRIPPNLDQLRQTFATRPSKSSEVLDSLRAIIESSDDLTPMDFNQRVAHLFPLDKDLAHDHPIVKGVRQLVGLRVGIKQTRALLLEYLKKFETEPIYTSLISFVTSLYPLPPAPEAVLKKDAKLKKLIEKYVVAVAKEAQQKKEMKDALDNFDLDAEFESFINCFFEQTSTHLVETYTHKQDVGGEDEADSYLKSHIRRFGIERWEVWVEAFKANYGLLTAPEREVYGHLQRAHKTTQRLLEALSAIKPIVLSLESNKDSTLSWASLEYSLPQLRDLIDEVHLSIQKIRSLNPALFRQIEVQMFNLRLMANRLSHLNDALDFKKYNTFTRRRDLKVLLKNIFEKAAGESSPLIYTFFDSLQRFEGSLQSLLCHPNALFSLHTTSLPSPNVSGRWHFQTSEPESSMLEEIVVPKDGDCGFRCLGVLRQEAATLLLQKSNNRSIRRSVADDIRSAFISGRLVGSKFPESKRKQYFKLHLLIDNSKRALSSLFLPNPLTSQAIISLIKAEQTAGHTDNVRQLKSLQKNLSELETLHQEIEAFTHSKETYEDFIRSEFQNGSGWLSYVRNGRGTLFALAQLLNIHVQLWEPDLDRPDHLNRIPLAEGLKGKTVHILHTDRLSHFNLLREYSLE